MQAEEENTLVHSRSPFIRGQSASLLIGSDVILPIEEEKELDLDLALEEVLEQQTECPADSFGLSKACEDLQPLVELEKGSNASRQLVDGLDEVMTNDESRRLSAKRSRRAASEDSGISSTSAFSGLRGRERHASASNSDCCGDSEGYVGDDVKNLSDFDSLSSSHRDNDGATTQERETVLILNKQSLKNGVSESQL